MSLRVLGRIGLAVLVAAGAIGVVAAPALAATVDLGIGLTGTTITPAKSGKSLTIKVTNLGTTKPAAASLIIDSSALDATKASVTYDGPTGCTTDKSVRTCPLSETAIPGPGATQNYWVPLSIVAGTRQGTAGKLTVSIKTEGDAAAGNNTSTATVTIGNRGPDLRVYADDVTARAADGTITKDPVPPGKVATLPVYVANEGDYDAEDIDLTITLPEHTTFAVDKQYEGCVVNANRRTVNCDLKRVNLRPRRETDTLPTGWSVSFNFDVQVAYDATGPFTPRGTVSADSTSPDFADLDPSDNADTFVIFVGGSGGTTVPTASASASAGSASPSASASASPSASASAGGVAGGDQDGGGLPITGPNGLALSGTGLSLIVIGIALLVATRRRRAAIED